MKLLQAAAIVLLSMPVMGQTISMACNGAVFNGICYTHIPSDAEQLADWIEAQWQDAQTFQESCTDPTMTPKAGMTYLRRCGKLTYCMSINGGDEFEVREPASWLQTIRDQEKRIQELERISKEFEKEANDALSIADKCINRLDNAKRILKNIK